MIAWYKEWFDTRFYHILYKKRNDAEAEAFISLLVQKLSLRPQIDRILDVCCGKGRHSKTFNKLGFEVLGIDLSENNIAEAQQFANETLSFKVLDMRQPAGSQDFDCVVNLFTSFGYFEDDADNQAAINAMAAALKPGGLLVLDYMNSTKAIEHLSQYYEKESEGILFKISKRIETGCIKKNIQFEAEGQQYSFEESVKVIDYERFAQYFEAASLHLEHTFGDYALGPFHGIQSDRMIFVCTKS